ncbi:putative leucine-rich repeat-containing protein DDB_G0290503 [Teleopsis dalmanni]|uniref:putative leucine-rich repeat-containing protein DDB_G0290503 n=1 Tax=Teleopsis dalmanni TaxID=139649 RepID=UPI0018CE5E2A|nr:putative leucine-rich repeat-containing protein DDB_G0290503 [Teleopsis dalmanni]
MDFYSPGYLISSDEYSNDEDDLMDAAISSQNTSKSEAHTESNSYKKKFNAKRMKDARKCVNWHKKWLINTKNRAKYRPKLIELIKILKNNKPLQSPEIQTSSLSIFPNNFDVPKSTIRFNDKEAVVDLLEEEVMNGNDSENVKRSDIVISSVISLENENDSIIKTSKIPDKVEDITNHEVMQPAQSNDIKLTYIKPKVGDIKTNNIKSKISHNHSVSNANVQSSKKRLRSISPPDNRNLNEDKKINSHNKFYSEINEMFAPRDQSLKTHINNMHSNGENIDAHINRLASEIDTINELIETRENEIQKLFYFKKIKEEIMCRLERGKQINSMKEKSLNTKSCTLTDLKEIEQFLFSSNTSSAEKTKPTSTKDLVENIANMGTVELEKERPNTSRLYSILLSKNILPRAQNANYSNASTKVENIPTLLRSSEQFENQQYLELRPKPNMGRQGPFRDVKSLIAEYQNQNLNKPQTGKRFKYHDFADSMPTHNESYNEDHLANFSYTSNRNLGPYNTKRHLPEPKGMRINEGYQNNYRMQIPHYESEDVSMSNNIPYSQRHYDNSHSLRKHLHTNTGPRLSGYVEMNNDNGVCQECMSNEALFVCAGCQNQWYCSRECQINAWEKHSEICDV